ncbi:MAG: HAD family hydrolase [Methylobacteriaceae bacterium]|nr:HAD family hydrolase [Methylobacteriaceae bacterium]
MSLSAILFDKDGTLIDFDRSWGPAAHIAMRQLAEGDEPKLARLAELMHFDRARERFGPDSPFISGSSDSYGPLWAQALGRADVAALAAEMDAALGAAVRATLTPIGAPLAVADALRTRGLRLGVATNDAEAPAREQVALLGLTDRLEFVAGYDSGFGGKPGPGMILAFAAQLGRAPSTIALVGDSLHDMHAARAAGAVAVAVLSGPARRETLAPHADHVLDDIAGLPDLVDRLRAAG